MKSKIDVINTAYSQIRYSGLTIDPSANETSLALERLEVMAAEFESRDICLNYNFEETPDANSATNVPLQFQHMLSTNLAVRMIPDFNKAVPQVLMLQASQSLSNASARSASDSVRQVNPPRRMPIGSGNSYRYNRYRRFQRPTVRAPNECATNKMLVGDIDDFQESFVSYLDPLEDISSFTITASSVLEIQSSSNSTSLVNYRIKALDLSTDTSFQQVEIVVTTTNGRSETRLINFEITSTT